MIRDTRLTALTADNLDLCWSNLFAGHDDRGAIALALRDHRDVQVALQLIATTIQGARATNPITGVGYADRDTLSYTKPPAC